MFSLTINLDSLAMYIVAADVLILLAFILYTLNKKRALAKSIRNITAFIEEYFMNTGTKVQVTCFKLEGDKRFVVLIQSQALKRFRCSNILESNLIAHISEITGNLVEKIYWRFPIQSNPDSMTATEENTPESDDSYFSEGHVMAKATKEYKVSEVPWDQYEEQKNMNTKTTG